MANVRGGNLRIARAGIALAAVASSVFGLNCGSSSSSPSASKSDSPPSSAESGAGQACSVTALQTGANVTGVRRETTVASGTATLRVVTELDLAGSWRRSERLEQNGQNVMSVDIQQHSDGTIVGSERLAASFGGSLHVATVSGKAGQYLDMVVDGVARPRFALDDLAKGTVAPVSLPGLPEPSRALLAELMRESDAVARSCRPSTSAGPGAKPLSAPFPGSAPGEGLSQASCDSCKSDCLVKFDAVVNHDTLIGCAWQDTAGCAAAAGTAGAFCGPFAPLCAGVVFVGCEAYAMVQDCAKHYNECVDTCTNSTDCCPVKCGHACCGEHEKCAVPDQGLCCLGTQDICSGTQETSCADPGVDVCLPNGHACSPGSLCANGNLCCDGFEQRCIHPDAGAEFCCDGATHDVCGPKNCCASGTCAGDGSSAHPYACCDSVDQTCGSKCCQKGQRCVGGQCITESVTCDSPPGSALCQQPGYASVCCYNSGCVGGQCCPIGQIGGWKLYGCDPTKCYDPSYQCVK